MDSFTLSVVIGIGFVLVVFLGLLIVDRGGPAEKNGDGHSK